MSSNHHDEAGPSFFFLVYSAMNMNEEMNAGLFLSLLTPRIFLMLILSLSSSPELVVLL